MILVRIDSLHPLAVVDLEGAQGTAALPLFAQNLPSNVSKTQDLRPKIREFIAISGGWPPFVED
jgi:hypothetical protein